MNHQILVKNDFHIEELKYEWEKQYKHSGAWRHVWWVFTGIGIGIWAYTFLYGHGLQELIMFASAFPFFIAGGLLKEYTMPPAKWRKVEGKHLEQREPKIGVSLKSIGFSSSHIERVETFALEQLGYRLGQYVVRVTLAKEAAYPTTGKRCFFTEAYNLE